MKKQIILHAVLCILFYFPLMNFVWSYKEGLSFFDREVLWFSVPVTIFSFVINAFSIVYTQRKKKNLKE